MESFYGGRQGVSFKIAKTYETIKEMLEDLGANDKFTYDENGKNLNEVSYGEYILISTVDINNEDNGKLYRRDFDKITFMARIVGPQGNAPEISLNHYDEIGEGASDISYTVDDGDLLPGIKIDPKGTTYNDTINIRIKTDEDASTGKITGSTIGFQMPYLINDFITGATLTPGEDIKIEQVGEKGHPFYKQYGISIPQGYQGKSVNNITFDEEGKLIFYIKDPSDSKKEDHEISFDNAVTWIVRTDIITSNKLQAIAEEFEGAEDKEQFLADINYKGEEGDFRNYLAAMKTNLDKLVILYNNNGQLNSQWWYYNDGDKIIGSNNWVVINTSVKEFTSSSIFLSSTFDSKVKDNLTFADLVTMNPAEAPEECFDEKAQFKYINLSFSSKEEGPKELTIINAKGEEEIITAGNDKTYTFAYDYSQLRWYLFYKTSNEISDITGSNIYVSDSLEKTIEQMFGDCQLSYDKEKSKFYIQYLK